MHLKLPAVAVLHDRVDDLPNIPVTLFAGKEQTFREIRYEENHQVGYLHFDFYNGAMSTEQCLRLRDAIIAVRERPTKVLVLSGGRSCWSNGVHLNVIEAAQDPAEESWRNINAFDSHVKLLTEALAYSKDCVKMLSVKQAQRNRDEFIKPLAAYRKTELQQMWENFFAPESVYHPARKQFVFKRAATETPLRLAKHRVPMCTRCPGVVCTVTEEVALKQLTAPA